ARTWSAVRPDCWIRCRIRSTSPGFCCTASCSVWGAAEGGGRGGFCATAADAPQTIPLTTTGRREKGEVLPGAPCGGPVRGKVICTASPRAREWNVGRKDGG